MKKTLIAVAMFSSRMVFFSSFSLAEEENFCDPAVTPDVCQDDRLNIRFVSGDTLVSELTNVVVDQVIPAKVTIDVVTAGISGFSYGVKHDSNYLTLPQPAPNDPTCYYDPEEITTDLSGCNPTIVGTTPLVESANVGGWNTTSLADGPNGFYSAVIFSMMKKKELPTAQTDYPICIMKYKCIAVPPVAGTKIQFTDELNPVGSPAVTVNLTTSGKSKRPKKVFNAVVNSEGEPPPSPPPLISPQDKEAVLPGEVLFKWGTSTGATRYQLQICTDASMVESKRILGSPFEPSAGVTEQKVTLDSGNYWWQVGAIGVDGSVGIFGPVPPWQVDVSCEANAFLASFEGEDFKVEDPLISGSGNDRPSYVGANLLATMEDNTTSAGICLNSGKFVRLLESAGEERYLDFDNSCSYSSRVVHIGMDLLLETPENYSIFFQGSRGAIPGKSPANPIAEIVFQKSGKILVKSAGGTSEYFYRVGKKIRVDTYFELDKSEWQVFISGVFVNESTKAIVDAPLGLMGIGFSSSEPGDGLDGALQLDNVVFEQGSEIPQPCPVYDIMFSELAHNIESFGLGTICSAHLEGVVGVERSCSYIDPATNLKTIDTFIHYLHLEGNDPTCGAITITLNPERASVGKVVEKMAGTNFPADSYFEVFMKAEIPQLGISFKNCAPAIMRCVVDKLPPLGCSYEIGEGFLVPLFFAGTDCDDAGVVNPPGQIKAAGHSPTVADDPVPPPYSEDFAINFRRGDCDGDGSAETGLTDAMYLLRWLFMGLEDPMCFDACDFDDNGSLSIADAIQSLWFNYMGGFEPSVPYPNCGTDPTLDNLDCQLYSKAKYCSGF